MGETKSEAVCSFVITFLGLPLHINRKLLRMSARTANVLLRDFIMAASGIHGFFYLIFDVDGFLKFPTILLAT